MTHAPALHEERVAPFIELLRLVNSNWVTQAIAVAAELGIMDRLARDAATADELAAATACDPPSLRRLLRALVSLGVCEQREDGSFARSDMGSLLETDAPMSLRAYAVRYGRYQWPAWGKLLDSVRTGKCARTLLDGTVGFEHLERDAVTASIYHRAMAEVTRLIAHAVIPAYDFGAFMRIVDVGGGYGEMLAAILRAYPGTRGVLFDRPAALEGAKHYLGQAGVADRCDMIAGDFFESVPAGADGYLLKSVIHDWSDERAAAILTCCRSAMPADAKLLLVEYVMPERMQASALNRDAARSDLNMMVMLGGRERTAAEYRSLLSSAGFHVSTIVPAGLNFSVIEAIGA